MPKLSTDNNTRPFKASVTIPMNKMSLADRMKSYEKEWRTVLDPNKYYILRLDGRSFSKYTKRFVKPYDTNLMHYMNKAGEAVSREMNSMLTYIQSDEISVFFHSPKKECKSDEMYFGGKNDKILTVSTSIVSNTFNKSYLTDLLLEDSLEQMRGGDGTFSIANHKFAEFDCRIIELPNLGEVINYFIWRQKDWIRNSVFMLGYNNFNNKSLNGINTRDLKIKILNEKGIDWNALSDDIKFGRIIQKTYYDKYIEQIDDTVQRSQYVAEPAMRFLHQNENEKKLNYDFFKKL